ncbi:hypothetical protein METY_0474 [Methylopila sp. Yamaguchi]|nr:hypothetical protein METY_0474 [Methylopila sp. Yamaguchi]
MVMVVMAGPNDHPQFRHVRMVKEQARGDREHRLSAKQTVLLRRARAGAKPAARGADQGDRSAA